PPQVERLERPHRPRGRRRHRVHDDRRAPDPRLAAMPPVARRPGDSRRAAEGTALHPPPAKDRTTTMPAKLSASLPADQTFNGLTAIAEDMNTEPRAMHYALIAFDTKSISVTTDTDEVTA